MEKYFVTVTQNKIMVGKNLKFMKMLKKVFFIITSVAFLYSCGVDHVNEPWGTKEIPKQITVTKVVDKEGSSVIYFQQPDDKNLKYVRAEWTTDDGVTMDATASFYTDSIIVQGFRDACNVDVKLYSVSYGNTSSEPVIQPVNPKTPPYRAIAETMSVTPYFLGLKTLADNETGARLSFYTYRKNDAIQGGWEEIGQYHTAAPKVRYTIGKQDTIETVFAVRIKDNFGHWSDYKEFTLKPWWEELCDKSKFAENKVYRIDEILGEPVWDSECTDWDGHQMHSWSGSNVSFDKLWDGYKMYQAARCYHTKTSGNKIPQSFCIDLGKGYTLSRVLAWPRASDTRMGGSSDDWQHVWKGGMPKHVRIYGSTYTGDDPTHNLADDFKDPSWSLIGDDFFRRADGSTDPLASGVGTEDDRLVLEAGFEVVFEDPGHKIRYIRFQTVELYSFATAVMLDELEFYGSDK
jgi:hypothetical protein